MNTQTESTSRYAVQAAVKTIDVLFAFQSADGPLAAADVAQRLGLTRSQAYRCLKTLEVVGLVREAGRGFALTDKLLQLVPAMSSPSLLAVAQPILLHLRDQTGETILLGVRIGTDEVHIIASFPTPHAIGMLGKVGTRGYLHAGSVPKAMLAFMPQSEIDRFLAMVVELPRYTSSTTVDPDHLRAELGRIRARGYAISDQDFEDGARGVGAPIFGPDGCPVAGLSIGGPASRIDDARLAHFGQLAMAAAAAISERLGYGAAGGALLYPGRAGEVDGVEASL